jgi:enediyne biosynthesis protein E4
LSVNDSRLHFGLGAITTVDAEVKWPSGQVELFTAIEADRLIFVREGSGITRMQRFT